MEDSWKQFSYSFMLRGGGPHNERMDLNYVSFTNNGFQYVLYQTYFVIGSKQAIGIKVTDLKTKKTIDIKGNTKTKNGSLTNLRENKLINTTDELFD